MAIKMDALCSIAAIAEGFNTKINVLKRRAFGFWDWNTSRSKDTPPFAKEIFLKWEKSNSYKFSSSCGK